MSTCKQLDLETLGSRNWSKSECFQVQPVTCSHHPVFLQYFEVYSFKMVGHFPGVFGLQAVIS